MFCAVHETTGKVLAGRRLETLNALGSRLVECHDPAGVVDVALAVCETNRDDLPFVGVYMADGETLLRGCTSGMHALFAEQAPSLQWWLAGGGAPTETLVIGGCRARLCELGARLGESAPERALVIPLVDGAGGEPFGWMVAGVNPLLSLDLAYRSFFELIAGQMGRAFGSARLYQLERSGWTHWSSWIVPRAGSSRTSAMSSARR